MIYPDSIQIWDRLRSVTQIKFRAQSGLQNGWNGEGEGSVTVENSQKDVLIFFEYGEWKSTDGHRFSFKNTYRWKRTASGLHLEHLRLGINNPVFLVELHPVSANNWKSRKPHACGDDLYSGTLNVHADKIHLEWIVRGPRKDEKLLNTYK